MNIKINKEQSVHYDAIGEINNLAFKQPQEAQLIEGLRKLENYIPELSLIAFDSVLLLGHPNYYPKFGFEKASKWKIKCPLDVPDEAWMALELKTGALDGKIGKAVFPKEYEEAV